MSFWGKKKKTSAPPKSSGGGSTELDQQIINLMEQLNIPKSGRDGVLKLPEAQKKQMLEGYKAKLSTATTKKSESGKDWSNKFNIGKSINRKLLQEFTVVIKDSDRKFAEEFIQELGMKRLCRISHDNISFDSQILLIFKAIIDTSQTIIKDIVNDNLTITTIASKVDAQDNRVRELAMKLLVTLVIVEDDDLSLLASSKIMSSLLDSARIRGYRNRWKSVISHLSVNEISGTGSFEYDNYALLLINFIISGLETVEERTDERRLLNSLKFNDALHELSESVNTATNEMKTQYLSESNHQARSRGLSNHQLQLQQYQYCQSVTTQITAYTRFREEDLVDLRKHGIMGENDLLSTKGLFKMLHDQVLNDGYINELTHILRVLITIPASGDRVWSNLTKTVSATCTPTQTSDYLSFKELQHLLKQQAHEEESEHNEIEHQLIKERKKVSELEKQIQTLQSIINKSELSHEQEAIDGLDRYKRLIKIKVPQQAIRNEMKQDGIDDTLIEKLFSINIISEKTDNKTSIKQQMERYEWQRKNINKETSLCLPLHKFSIEDICNVIQRWVYNDINHKKYLFQTMKLLSDRKISTYYSIDNVKRIIQTDLLAFMTCSKLTVDIMFDSLKELMQKDASVITNKSAPEIGFLLYHFPLNSLLRYIKKKKISGANFQNEFEKQFIENQTGWTTKEAQQIAAVLFRFKTFTKHEFETNMDKIMNDTNYEQLTDTVKYKIKNTILQFEVETILLKIKQGKNIDEFSGAIINMVDELVLINEENKTNDTDKMNSDTDFVKKVYELIAECFAINNVSSDETDISLDKQKQWICQNCSNFNFNKYIGSKLSSEISDCSLCGIRQTDSIILKLRNYDTFSMVKSIRFNDEIKQEKDEIDLLIEDATQHGSLRFDLQCPNRNDNKQCPSLFRLAKQLITYKRWINTVYNKIGNKIEVEKTIPINIERFVTNDVYQKIFIESARNIKKINEKNINLLTKLIDNNDNVANIDHFLSIGRKTFAKQIQKHTRITMALAGKLYVGIRNKIKEQAQTEQFGTFLTNLHVDNDYHHILKCHINEGNKITIKNTFQFFSTVVHYDDKETEIEECKSFKRRKERINSLISEDSNNKNVDINIANKSEDKNIWSLHQYYIQSQLDLIHSYLVHSNWKFFVQRYSNKHNEEYEYK
eukprot:521342_1